MNVEGCTTALLQKKTISGETLLGIFNQLFLVKNKLQICQQLLKNSCKCATAASYIMIQSNIYLNVIH